MVVTEEKAREVELALRADMLVAARDKGIAFDGCAGPHSAFGRGQKWVVGSCGCAVAMSICVRGLENTSGNPSTDLAEVLGIDQSWLDDVYLAVADVDDDDYDATEDDLENYDFTAVEVARRLVEYGRQLNAEHGLNPR